MEYIKSLTRLEKFNFSNDSIGLDGLESLSHLRKLDLGEVKFGSLLPLWRSLTSLESLKINSLSHHEHMLSVLNMTNLIRLSLSHVSTDTNLSRLGKLRSLTFHNSYIPEVVLKCLTSLTKLKCSHSREEEDDCFQLETLETLPRLREVVLETHGTRISEFDKDRLWKRGINLFNPKHDPHW